MLGKRSRSNVIARLSDLLVSGSHSSLIIDHPFLSHRSETIPNPSPYHQSINNNCFRNFDLGHHGVGLGIVVALEKSSSPSSSSIGGGCSKYFVCSPRGQNRSEKDDEEDYTYVTFHGPRVSFTMVYYDQIEKERREDVRDHDDSDVEGFLCYCQRCGKKLHGQDIYMYRGEKGFCSADCRSAQIITDERSEQCRSSSSSTTNGQILSTSIIAV